MSKMVIGRYEDGSIKHSYFRITRHHRIKRNGFLPIRWKLYVAKSWQMEKQLTYPTVKSILK
jgi:hypothetical protein